MAKKPSLTLKDLQAATSMDDLPTMVPLLAEVERLTTEEAELSKAVQEAYSRLTGRPVGAYASSSPPPTPPDTVTEFDRLTTLARDGSRRLKRLQYELADAQKAVRTEIQRVQEAVDDLLKPMMLETTTRLMKVLETAVPIDAELRGLEQLRSRFVMMPSWVGLRPFAPRPSPVFGQRPARRHRRCRSCQETWTRSVLGPWPRATSAPLFSSWEP